AQRPQAHSRTSPYAPVRQDPARSGSSYGHWACFWCTEHEYDINVLGPTGGTWAQVSCLRSADTDTGGRTGGGGETLMGTPGRAWASGPHEDLLTRAGVWRSLGEEDKGR